jgi:hypothetical protein
MAIALGLGGFSRFLFLRGSAGGQRLAQEPRLGAVERAASNAIDEPGRGGEFRLARVGAELDQVEALNPATLEQAIQLHGNAGGQQLAEHVSQLNEPRPRFQIGRQCQVRLAGQYLPGESREHGLRADFDKNAGAGRMHRGNLVREAHRRNQMLGELPGDG